MNNISPTRSSLLELKNKIKLAQKGHSLLKKKQDYLIAEFFKYTKDYKEAKEKVSSKTKEVYDSLSLEIAYSGIFVSRSVSFAAKENFELDYKTKNIMGVKIPVLHAKTKGNLYNTYENAPLLADARNNFQELLIDLIHFASIEQTLLALANEIQKVKRRVNSLEHIQLPKLKKQADYVKFVLGEQDRENFIRLKVVKKNMQEA